MEILEGLRHRRRGGPVNLAGDWIRSRTQRDLAARFAGGRARLPEIPGILTLRPALPFTSFGRGTRQGGHLSLAPPGALRAEARTAPVQAVPAAAQTCAAPGAVQALSHPDRRLRCGPPGEPLLQPGAGY